VTGSASVASRKPERLPQAHNRKKKGSVAGLQLRVRVVLARPLRSCRPPFAALSILYNVDTLSALAARVVSNLVLLNER
jgi:hypothetical protein